MRFPARVWTSFAVLALTVLSPSPSADAAGGNVKVSTPLVRVSETIATGQGTASIAAKGDEVTVTFSVAGLPPAVQAPLDVFLEASPGGGTYTKVTSIASLTDGGGKVVHASASGVPPELGVPDLAALVGRRVAVRDQGGTDLLAGLIPSLTKAKASKFSAKLTPLAGSPQPSASAKLSGGFTVKSGTAKIELTVKGLAPGAYTVFIEDAPGSGVFVAVGDLNGDSFVRDELQGDAIPLVDIGAFDFLSGRAVQVRDANGAPVLGGSFPRFGLAISWPQTHVFLMELGDGFNDRVLKVAGGALVVYRSLIDLSKTSVGTIRRDEDALWQVDLVGAEAGSLVVTIRLADDLRTWMSSSSGGGQHILGLYTGTLPPVNPDQVRFILHKENEKTFGKGAHIIESKLYRGEHLVDLGHGLAGNGVLIQQSEQVILIR